ncbi:MAG: phospho-N-acetylmuramoyl-pentapeptide-transferase [Synergistes sp.]|nr:phospho-N-acetylmuramoyl-pentapeptide-transferase [Synergistes sp.]
MFIVFTAVLLFAFAAEVLLQSRWIRAMHRMRIEQVTKLYGPAWHEKTKVGTPTMGGVVFIPVLLLSIALISVILGDLSPEYALKIVSYPILAAAVGFIDDWRKHTRQSSDGLKSLQKLALQILVTAPWAYWLSSSEYLLFPGIVISRPLFVVLVTFVGVGLQNAVNVTDGLDGLACGCALISFLFAQIFLNADPALSLVIASACGICLGFMWHNCNPASVFMGDAGAHFIAGLLLSVCVNAGAFIFVIPVCFFFGVEIFSSAIQIFSIRVFHRKVFKMSPIHHHFELLGWKETQIVTRFWIMHIIGICLLMSILIFLVNRTV